MELHKASSKVIRELLTVFLKIDSSQIEIFTDAIIEAKRVFVVGVGREGLSSRALAM